MLAFFSSKVIVAIWVRKSVSTCLTPSISSRIKLTLCAVDGHSHPGTFSCTILSVPSIGSIVAHDTKNRPTTKSVPTIIPLFIFASFYFIVMGTKTLSYTFSRSKTAYSNPKPKQFGYILMYYRDDIFSSKNLINLQILLYMTENSKSLVTNLLYEN